MRKASSMIELVIAIVVMGIAVSALPMVLTQSQNSNALSLQQEVVMATKTKISYILGYDWDANTYDDNASVSRVLETNTSTGAASAFKAIDANSTRRIGHVFADNRRRLWDVNAIKRFPNSETSGRNDIDDFNGTAAEENTTISAGDMDYIFTVTFRPIVTYVRDTLLSGSYDNDNITFDFNTTGVSGPTNIKMIEVNTTGQDINTVLRAFACNIGESQISKRAW